MPPYLPSLAWVGTCLWHVADEKCSTLQRAEGTSLPNEDKDLSHVAMKTREYTRTLIGSNSPDGMVLTVPVVGGSSAAKRLKPEQLEISAHGDWTRIHLGAIEAAYGREPYFQHYFPGIAGIIEDYPTMLEDMNGKLLSYMLSCISYNENIHELEKMKILHLARYTDIRNRLMNKVNPSHSFIEPLFRLGRDSLFML